MGLYSFKLIRWLMGGHWYHYAFFDNFGLQDFWSREQMSVTVFGRLSLIGEEHYER